MVGSRYRRRYRGRESGREAVGKKISVVENKITNDKNPSAPFELVPAAPFGIDLHTGDISERAN